MLIPRSFIRRSTLTGAFTLLLASQGLAIQDFGLPAGTTTEPLNDPRWNSTVNFGVGTGTIIAPSYFLTAQHFESNTPVGTKATLTTNTTGTPSSAQYTTINSWDIAGSDLRVVQISGTFANASITPLYNGGANTEPGQAISMIGCGPHTHGAAVVTATIQNGWVNADDFSGVPSYGDGTAAAIVSGGPGGENLISFNFGTTPTTRGMYGPGDSGGGMFILHNGAYQLAGVAYGVTQFYSQSGSSPNFTYTPIDGVIYNSTGLFEQTTGGTYITATDPQSVGYASEVAPFVSQINALVPEPATLAIICIGGGLLLARRRQRAR